MASPPAVPISLETAPPKVHLIGRASRDGQEFDTPASPPPTQGSDLPAQTLRSKDSLESTRSFYNLPSAAPGGPGSAGRQSPTPSHSSFYHQQPASRLSAHSLTSPSAHSAALPAVPRPPQQSAFTSGVLPARGFFAPQKPGDARRAADPNAAAAALRKSESASSAVEMGGTPSRFDPRPYAGPTASETSFGAYASSRQASEEGSVEPSSARGLRLGDGAGAQGTGGGGGGFGYKESREQLIDDLAKPAGRAADSPRLNFGTSQKLSLASGFGGARKDSSAAAAAGGGGGSPYLGSNASRQRTPVLGSTTTGSPRLGDPRADAAARPPTKRVKAHTLHASANSFALGGKLVTGGDASPFPLLGSFVIELGLGAIWIGTTGARIWQHGVGGDGGRGGIAIVIVFLWLWGMSIGAMIGTAFRDPGILPRNLDPAPQLAPTRSSHSLVPLPRELRVRAGKVTVKYCESCRIYRPPRASHCRICDNCVDGIDHHCAYLHTCVGRNNYTSFLSFLFFSVVCLVWVVVWSAVYLARASASRGQTIKDVLKDEAGSGVIFCLALLMLLPVGSLMSYHVWLMLNNSTTIEEIRRTAQRSMSSANPMPPSRLHRLAPCLASVQSKRGEKQDEPGNPFTFGRWWTNLGRTLCRPRVGSWMRFDADARAGLLTQALLITFICASQRSDL